MKLEEGDVVISAVGIAEEPMRQNADSEGL